MRFYVPHDEHLEKLYNDRCDIREARWNNSGVWRDTEEDVWEVGVSGNSLGGSNGIDSQSLTACTPPGR